MKRIIVSTMLTGVVLVMLAGYVMAAVLRVDQTPWQLAVWLGGNICLGLTGLFMWKWLRFDAVYPLYKHYRSLYKAHWRKHYDQALEQEAQQKAIHSHLDSQLHRYLGVPDFSSRR